MCCYTAARQKSVEKSLKKSIEFKKLLNKFNNNRMFFSKTNRISPLENLNNKAEPEDDTNEK